MLGWAIGRDGFCGRSFSTIHRSGKWSFVNTRRWGKNFWISFHAFWFSYVSGKTLLAVSRYGWVRWLVVGESNISLRK